VVSLPENIHLISKSGTQVPIDDSLAPVQIDSGRILGSILVFRDATNRRQNEAALVESERQRMQAQRMEAIGRLAGGIAHDFNNLLTVIIGHADFALKQVGSVGPGRSGLEEILNAGQKAAGLTRQLLVFSRGQPLKLEVIDLNHVVTNIEKLLRRLIGEDIELVSALTDESVFVKADVGQMEQVIVNLATNARDAMPGGGRLTLETTVRRPDESAAQSESGAARTDYAVLRVIDTGIGMDPETKLRVFEPFFTTKEIGKGTGLGLSITDSIVKNHHGDLRVQSDPGKGSVFEICIPRVEGLPQETRRPFNPEERPHDTATILLVEDNEEVRHLTRDILTSLGHLVLEAPNGEAGFQAAQSYAGRIDLMVSDLVMPGLSGVELAKRLALLRPETRVLYMSGYAEHNLTASVLRDPAVGYLQKPFTPAELARRVNEMVTGAKKPRGENSL
jgi:signal transduction histidine kinase/CheY-like chemotaxis protein